MDDRRQWRVSHGSVTGTRHMRNGEVCQDHSCHLQMPRISGDTLVAAVADGMGSARLGGPGAHAASEAAATAASLLLWERRAETPAPERMESLLYASMLAARLTLEEKAAEEGAPLEDLATTLLLMVHTRGMIATAQVGDGAAVASTQRGEYRTLATPQRGEYANETTPITTKRALHHCQITIVRTPKPVREIALLTDGLLNVSMDMSTLDPHPPFFANMSDWLRAHRGPEHPNQKLRDTLSSDLITRRTDDDLTLLLAVRTDLP